jgi:hypothetical protein
LGDPGRRNAAIENSNKQQNSKQRLQHSGRLNQLDQ